MTPEFSTKRLDGAVAVVTGGGSGIGRGICQRLADEGAAVALVDRDEVGGSEVAEGIASQGLEAMAVTGDVADQGDLNRTLEEVAHRYNRVPDIVVSNAGEQTFTNIWELTDEEWRRVFDTNVRGTFLTLRTFAAAMKSNGIAGSMVTISSVRGRLGAPLYAHYAASKAAVMSLTKSFALELAPNRIRVNTVAPGAIRTPLWERASREMADLMNGEPDQMRAERVAQIPLNRFGEPEDVAAAVSYLASDDSAYVTGECIHVCGGDMMI